MSSEIALGRRIAADPLGERLGKVCQDEAAVQPGACKLPIWLMETSVLNAELFSIADGDGQKPLAQ